MKKTCVTFLAEHGITLLTGTLLGVTITAGMCYKNYVDFWQTVGTVAAGFGTVGLLLFGFMTASNWKEQIRENHRVQFQIENCKAFYNSVDLLCRYLRSNPESELAPSNNKTGSERKDIEQIFTLLNSVFWHSRLLFSDFSKQRKNTLSDEMKKELITVKKSLEDFEKEVHSIRNKLLMPPYCIEDNFTLSLLGMNAQRLAGEIIAFELK